MAAEPRWPEELQLQLVASTAAELIAAALGLPGPEELREPPRQVQLQHRPGAGVSALYDVRTRDGQVFVGLSTERLEPAEGLVRIEIPLHHFAGDAEAGTGPATAAPASPAVPWDTLLAATLWRHPHDPRLPGLALAAQPERVAAQWGEGDELKRLETVAYRPLRRAVMLAEFATPAPLVETRRLYLKVMRPGQAAALYERHRLLASAGLPVPRPLGKPVDDVVALAEAPGEPLSRQLMHDGGANVDPGSLLALLDAIPEAALALPRRPAWTDRLGRYASAAAAALPREEDRIAGLRRRIEELLSTSDRGPVVPTHGDFYEANLLMDGDTVSGLLDVDAVGPGHRVDDLACFLGHLGVLPAVDTRYVHVPEALDRFGGVFAASVDARALWARAAGVAVSLVAGARTPGRPGWEPQGLARLEAAEQLADRAG